MADIYVRCCYTSGHQAKNRDKVLYFRRKKDELLDDVIEAVARRLRVLFNCLILVQPMHRYQLIKETAGIVIGTYPSTNGWSDITLTAYCIEPND